MIDDDGAAARKVLVFGYDSIYERSLKQISVSAIALEGLQGFGTIDPALSIKRIGNRIRMSDGNRVIGEYTAPADGDSKGWADVTVAAANDGRAASEAMRRMDNEALFEAVFDSTLAKLDVFSRYSGAREAQDHRASRNGFGGVGLRFDSVAQDAEIVEVLPGSPSAHAGLRTGDRITHIEGTPIAGLEKEDVSRRLRGAVASDVALSFRRKNVAELMTVSLRRALIVSPTVTLALHDGIAHLRISSFNQRTASNLAENLRAARDQAKGPLKGVLLDLRGNPGGLLDQAVSVADLFMAKGPIVSTRGRHRLSSQSYEASKGDIAEDVPLVVLVDGKSASAAEIVASALQDSGRAVVVGTNSYGKGTVQTVIRLPNDGEMTLTWSRFHSPSGYALHGLGVLPTICTADDQADSVGLVAAVRDGRVPVAASLAAWRGSDVEEIDLRRELRRSCPSQKHADAVIDPDIGRKLLTDQALYAQALSLGAPITTASRNPSPGAYPSNASNPGIATR